MDEQEGRIYILVSNLMRRTGPILRQQKDTCSCWVCRDEKFRAKRKTEKEKAMNRELKHIDN